MKSNLECVLCGSPERLSIVWSVSYGTNPEIAEQVVVCRNCRATCDTCEQDRVTDEIHHHRDSATNLCERCRLVMYIENDRYSRVSHHRAELARWKGADGPVAFQGHKLLQELNRAEQELIRG